MIRYINILCIFFALLTLSLSAFASQNTCLIEPSQTLSLSTPVSGLVEKIAAKRGDAIKKGQLLVSLSSKSERAAAELAKFKSDQMGPFQQAQAKAEFAKRKFERKKSLSSEKLLSAQDSDDAESDYRLALADIQVAKENKQSAGLEHKQQLALLEARSIYAPFNGVVVDQQVFSGEVVEAGGSKPILKVANIEKLNVRVILSKENFGKIKLGQKVQIEPEIGPKRGLVGTVKQIDRIIDAASGTFVVVVDLPNQDQLAPVGVRCKVKFQ